MNINKKSLYELVIILLIFVSITLGLFWISNRSTSSTEITNSTINQNIYTSLDSTQFKSRKKYETPTSIVNNNNHYKVDSTFKKIIPENENSENIPIINTIISSTEDKFNNNYSLDKNVVHSNYKPTSSGLIIIDEIIGTGNKPEIGNTVHINYTGMLEDGTQFDNSNNKKTIRFSIGRGKVMKGWDEGIASMRIGGKRRLIVPPELGYGSKGAGKTIPKNATLIFDIELIDINDELLISTQNKEKVEIIKPSGLKMTIHKEGIGEHPKRGQRIVVHYAGELLDGTPFESSYESRKPFIFTLGLGEVIPAFEEAFSEMKKGGVRTLQVPPHLGYGDRVLEKIPKYSTLIYKVELIDFY